MATAGRRRRVLAAHALAHPGPGIHALGRRLRAHLPRRRGIRHQRGAARRNRIPRHHAHRHRARIRRLDGRPADRAAVRRPAFLRQSQNPRRRLRLGQRLRPAGALLRAPGPSGPGVRLLPVLAGGGIDPEPHPRADRQYRRRHRPACRLGRRAAHAAGEHTTSGSAPAYSAWVGRFDGLLGYWLLPWGDRHRRALVAHPQFVLGALSPEAPSTSSL